MKIVVIGLCLFFSICLSAIIINIPEDQPTIQAGIDTAVDADTVLVQPGTYYENINYNGKNITIASLFLTTQDTTYISQTIIDGDSLDSVVIFENGEDSTAVLFGLNITNGYAYIGGGICCVNNSSPSLISVIISENIAIEEGGGISSYYSNPSLINVIISDNISGFGGGGFFFNHSSPSLVNVKIFNNFASVCGGGIRSFYSNLILMNVIISNNIAVDGWGGGIYLVHDNLSLINVIISNNIAGVSGGGIFCSMDSHTIIINSILWNDSPEELSLANDYDYPSSIVISYSDVHGGEAGIVYNIGYVGWSENNINEDPLFLGTGNHPLMLQDLSPCVNAGTPNTTGLNLPDFDFEGNPRIFGGRIDMGAYENQNVISDAMESLILQITKLNQNYPNPFNPTTTIEFSIQNESKVELIVYNIKGQKINTLANNELTPGLHSITWNGDDETGKSVSSGIYYYKLNVNGKIEAVKKCLLLK